MEGDSKKAKNYIGEGLFKIILADSEEVHLCREIKSFHHFIVRSIKVLDHMKYEWRHLNLRQVQKFFSSHLL